jgi:hypothetical protein
MDLKSARSVKPKAERWMGILSKVTMIPWKKRG